jgi:hypothetical protein
VLLSYWTNRLGALGLCGATGSRWWGHMIMIVRSGPRGSDHGRWWRFEEAASVSYAAATLLWGWVVALLGFGLRYGVV